MFKKIMVVLIALAFAGCASKEPEVISTDLPFKGYKQEVEEYEKARALQQPSPSLWGNTNQNLFADYKARYIGDIVIVQIVEKSTANNSNKTATDRSSNYNASVDTIFGLPLDMGMGNFLGSGSAFDPTISATTNNTWEGSGSKGKSDSIQGTIAARVTEILPSGNLVIEGQKEIVVDQEKQTITISGVVRQKDVNASNVVDSSAVADMQITYSGDGVITDANRKGWLATFIDWVWPF